MARPATYLHGMAFLAASLLALASSPASAAAPWSPAAYPNPMIDVGACGRQGVTSRICDPDSILTYDAANVVESYLKEIAEGVEPFKPGDCAGEAKGFQVAVALMSSMEVPSGTTVEAESGIFAQRLMDAWGVGEAACNNGVLLLLSRDDRRMHVATGRGAAGALPDNVIDEIIAGVRPELKEGNYAGAVTRSVVDIGHALSGDRPQVGCSSLPLLSATARELCRMNALPELARIK
mmetsp:Transcript_584/g.1863  ORF Transcript_584/g.1863 Transcript_584/m.1863 type:complete len:236 (-) Transcript_584:509-1216(-)